jgi:hypothetical protein
VAGISLPNIGPQITLAAQGTSNPYGWQFNTTNPTVNITAQANQSYALSFFGMGWTTYGPQQNGNLGAPLSGSFTPLSPGGGYSARAALNFQGIGLPENLFNNFVNWLNIWFDGTNASENYMYCGDIGYCTLPAPCENYRTILAPFSQ